MPAVVVPQPLRSLYAGAMVVTIVLAGGFAHLVAQSLGSQAVASGEAQTTVNAPLMTSIMVVGVSLVTVLPAMVSNGGRFGLAVLGIQVSRMLLAGFAALLVTQIGTLPARPVLLGGAAGMGLILVVESIAAIFLLSHVHRLKSAGGDSPTGVESSQAC